MRSLLTLLVVFLVAYSQAASQYELNVDPVNGVDSTACNTNGSSNVISPSTPCRSIGYAIAPVTSADFLQLKLQAGTYTGPSNTNLNFIGSLIDVSGVSSGGAIIDCAYAASSTAFSVTPSIAVQTYEFSNIQVRRCRSSSGAVTVLAGLSQVSFTNMVFESNHATQSGGAIFSQSFVLDVEKCIFRNNSAVQNGGAIAIQNQQGLTIASSAFINNTADTGGAIYVSNIATTFIPFFNNNFTYNSAAKQGGAFFGTFTNGNTNQTYDFFGSLFHENCATSAYSDSYTVQLRCASSGYCKIDTDSNSTSGCLGIYKPPETSSDESSGKKNKDNAIIIGVVVPFGILAILSIALFLYIRKRHNKEMSKRDDYRKKILMALDNLPPEEQEAARMEAARADPNAPKCQLCETRPRIALPCGHQIVCAVCRTILIECPNKKCKMPVKG